MESKGGFTIIELIIVVVILSLATVLSVAWIKSIQNARIKKALEHLSTGLKLSAYQSIIASSPSQVVLYPNCQKVIFINSDRRWEVQLPKGTQCYILGKDGPSRIEEKTNLTIKGFSGIPDLEIEYKGRKYTVNATSLSVWKKHEGSPQT